MYAAFCFVGVAPASGALVFPCMNFGCAGAAPDGWEALGHQRMTRQIMCSNIGAGLNWCEICKRIDLDVRAVFFEKGKLRALPILEPLAPGNPAAKILQRILQGLRFAQIATGIRINLMQQTFHVGAKSALRSGRTIRISRNPSRAATSR